MNRVSWPSVLSLFSQCVCVLSRLPLSVLSLNVPSLHNFFNRFSPIII